MGYRAMTRAAIVATLAVSAVGPGTAAASQSPVKASASITGPFKAGKRLFHLIGQPLRVNGSVASYAAGQRVKIKVTVNGRLARRTTVALRAGTGGRGIFSYQTRISGAGRMVVVASHDESAVLGAFSTSPPSVLIYSPVLNAGGNGIAVGVLHAMLRNLGYWAPGGYHYGAGTGKAVLAYRKVNRMPRIESANYTIYRLLHQRRGAIRARYPAMGEHLEADLSRQVLTFFRGSRPIEVHVISSGKPSTPTVLGRFQFYMKTPGTNDHGMVHSAYFYGGYAVHGYVDLPVYPASHGCLRVWVPLARHIYDRIRNGEWIAVFW